MSRVQIAVALAAYNGARFLAAQLDSIAAQTRPPDLLIIADDASTDASATIAERFAAAAPFPVRVERASANVGVAGNFERAFRLCAQADVIAPADQDDVWLPDKLARFEAALTERPDAGLVFSDAALVDADGAALGVRLWTRLGFSTREQQAVARGGALGVMLRHRVVTGAALAFRARWLDRILPIPPDWTPDAWIALVVALYAPLVLLPAATLHYRQHADNQIGATVRPSQRADHARRAKQYTAAVERIGTWDDVPDQTRVLARLREKAAHEAARAALPQGRLARLPRVVTELAAGRYARCSVGGWKSAAKDVLARGEK